MRNYLLIGSILVILILGGYFLFASSGKTLITTQTSSGTFPMASSTASNNSFSVGGSIGGNTTGPQTSTMTIAARGTGQAITVDDFIHNGITALDVQNPGNYYLAGAPGYCLPDGTCPHGATTTDFSVTYDAGKEFFTISLTKEPIGQARLDAEQFLLTTLGISEGRLCNINYYVGTTYWVNQFYDNKNLGFSFCPDATALPQ